MNDEAVSGLLTRYMSEAAPTIPAVPGIDLGEYQTTLRRRFANPAVADTVLRLAEDGSQKMPGFLGPALSDAMDAGSEAFPAAALALGLWHCASAV